MSEFEKALAFVASWEGGYSNRADDAGGETNFGISTRQYPGLTIKNVTQKQAAELFRRDYWDKIQGDKLPTPVAFSVFDFAVNSGVSKASKELQRAANATALTEKRKLKIDGRIGKKTLSQITTLDLEDPSHSTALARRITSTRRLFLRRLTVKRPADAANLKGWMNRLDALDKALSDL